MQYLGALPEAQPAVRNSYEAGRAAMEACNWDEAIAQFQDAMQQATGSELVALHTLVGQCHSMPGRWEQALASYRESARLARTCGDRHGQAVALDRIGVIWRNLGSAGDDRFLLDRALANHNAALSMFREDGSKRAEALTLVNIGGVDCLKQDWDKALACFEAALKIERETGERAREAQRYANIGIIHLKLGRREKALEYNDKALAIAREDSLKELEVCFLCMAGHIWLDGGKPDKALEAYESAAAVSREAGLVAATPLGGAGQALAAMGRHDKAVARFLEAGTAFSRMGLASRIRENMARLAICLERLGPDRFIVACVKAGRAKAEAEGLVRDLVRRRNLAGPEQLDQARLFLQPAEDTPVGQKPARTESERLAGAGSPYRFSSPG